MELEMKDVYAHYLVADRLLQGAKRAGVRIVGVTINCFSNSAVSLQTGYQSNPEKNEADLVALAKAMPDLHLRRNGGTIYLEGETALGIKFQIYVGEGVCERVQVGTKKVVKIDPDYLANAPTIMVDEPVFEVMCPDPLRDLLAEPERELVDA